MDTLSIKKCGQNLTGFVDSDEDTYTIGNEVEVCSGDTLPAGYQHSQSVIEDCDDNNPLVGLEPWDKTFGGSDDDVAKSIQQTFDGGYIVAGFTEWSKGAGKFDA